MEYIINDLIIGFILILFCVGLFFIPNRWLVKDKNEWCDKGGLHKWKVLDKKSDYFIDSGFKIWYDYCEKRECEKCGKIENPCGLGKYKRK